MAPSSSSGMRRVRKCFLKFRVMGNTKTYENGYYWCIFYGEEIIMERTDVCWKDAKNGMGYNLSEIAKVIEKIVPPSEKSVLDNLVPLSLELGEDMKELIARQEKAWNDIKTALLIPSSHLFVEAENLKAVKKALEKFCSYDKDEDCVDVLNRQGINGLSHACRNGGMIEIFVNPSFDKTSLEMVKKICHDFVESFRTEAN